MNASLVLQKGDIVRAKVNLFQMPVPLDVPQPMDRGTVGIVNDVDTGKYEILYGSESQYTVTIPIENAGSQLKKVSDPQVNMVTPALTWAKSWWAYTDGYQLRCVVAIDNTIVSRQNGAGKYIRYTYDEARRIADRYNAMRKQQTNFEGVCRVVEYKERYDSYEYGSCPALFLKPMLIIQLRAVINLPI